MSQFELIEARARIEAMQAEVERLNDHLLEAQMLAHKWMEAHDKRAAGKPYKCPSPADLPNALAEVGRLRETLDYARGTILGQQIILKALTGRESIQLETAVERIEASLDNSKEGEK